MDWQYHINYGPDGEANYANLTTPEGEHVANIKTHHAHRIVTELAEARVQIAAKDAALREAGQYLETCEANGLNCKLHREVISAALTGEQFAEYVERAEDDVQHLRAQIAARDALLQECLDWFDAPFESDCESDMEMAVRVRAALATPARETE